MPYMGGSQLHACTPLLLACFTVLRPPILMRDLCAAMRAASALATLARLRDRSSSVLSSHTHLFSSKGKSMPKLSGAETSWMVGLGAGELRATGRAHLSEQRRLVGTHEQVLLWRQTEAATVPATGSFVCNRACNNYRVLHDRYRAVQHTM